MTPTASVLVVDDDPLLLEIATELLRSRGYDCDVAQDGEIAIQSLNRKPVDLVVLDVIMPNKEGIEVLLDIKRFWPSTRVLMISGGARMIPAGPLLDMAKALGADAVLAKPLLAEEFLATVDGLLRQPARSAA
jgi:DNA-binding response OmpR family regulator